MVNNDLVALLPDLPSKYRWSVGSYLGYNESHKIRLRLEKRWLLGWKVCSEVEAFSLYDSDNIAMDTVKNAILYKAKEIKRTYFMALPEITGSTR